jgi:hypothetical protein
VTAGAFRACRPDFRQIAIRAKKFVKLDFYHSLRYRATAVISKRVKLFGGVNDKEISSIN